MSWLQPPQPAFPTIALKTPRRFQQRPQAPPEIYTKRFIGIRRNKEGGINYIPRPVVEALKENAHQKEYLAVKGLAALREAVADYHARKHSIRRTAADVLVGPGSKELMFLIQARLLRRPLHSHSVMGYRTSPKRASSAGTCTGFGQRPSIIGG